MFSVAAPCVDRINLVEAAEECKAEDIFIIKSFLTCSLALLDLFRQRHYHILLAINLV